MKSIFNSAFLIFISLAVLVSLFSPLASDNPDGLDWTIEKHAAPAEIEIGAVTENESAEGLFLFTDYKISFIKNEAASTIVAGMLGLFIIMAFYKIFFRYAVRPAGKALSSKDNITDRQNAL